MAQHPAASPEPSSRAVLPPHVPLTEYYPDEPERHRFVRRIFDETAADYDRIERVLAFGTGPWYRLRALRRAHLKAGDRLVDVGIGTGMLAREALKIIGPSGTLTGVDPSSGMMSQVNLPGVQLVTGRAESMPCADASADFLTLGYALRHVSDLSAAFTEFHRVMRPGARLLLLEITRPKSRLGLLTLKFYMRWVVPAIAKVMARRKDTPELFRYYWDTIEACVPPEAVLEALRAAGFKRVRRFVELGMFSEYMALKPPLVAPATSTASG